MAVARSRFETPVFVWDRSGKVKGTCTGGGRWCPMEGCQGLRIGVRWPDGKLTYPCTRGMRPYRGKGHWKIV